jgi:glycosyltransferase involved in cell wall biosynthesis
MRVLFATEKHYLPQAAGGSESSTHELCLALRERGRKIAVLAAIKPEGWIHFRNRLLRSVRRTAYPPDNVMGYPVFRGWEPIAGLEDVCNAFRPTCAVVNAGWPQQLAQGLLSIGIPTLIYVRDPEFEKDAWRPIGHSRAVHITNSDYMAGRFEAAHGFRPGFIPPLIWGDRYRVDTDRTYATFINLAPEKGIDIAFALARSCPDIPFLFVEGWPLSPEQYQIYKNQADACGNVRLMRRVGDMRTIYRQSRLILIPSRWQEAWGRVATEAHVSGIPVIATNFAGLPESVGPGGLLVEREADWSAWTAALRQVWDDAETYDALSRAAREYSKRDSIQPDTLIRNFEEFLSSLSKSA